MQENTRQSLNDKSRTIPDTNDPPETSRFQHFVDRATETYIGIVQQRAKIILVSFISGGFFGVLCFSAGYLANG